LKVVDLQGNRWYPGGKLNLNRTGRQTQRGEGGKAFFGSKGKEKRQGSQRGETKKIDDKQIGKREEMDEWCSRGGGTQKKGLQVWRG